METEKKDFKYPKYDHITLLPKNPKTMKKNKGIHNEIIKKLEDRLKESKISYDFILSNTEYKKGVNVLGECDLWARYTTSNGTIHDLFFEIKCNDISINKKQALEQLRKEECYLGDPKGVSYRFFVSKEGIRLVKREDYSDHSMNYHDTPIPK